MSPRNSFSPKAVSLEPCPCCAGGTVEKQVPSRFQNFCIDLAPKYQFWFFILYLEITSLADVRLNYQYVICPYIRMWNLNQNAIKSDFTASIILYISISHIIFLGIMCCSIMHQSKHISVVLRRPCDEWIVMNMQVIPHDKTC